MNDKYSYVHNPLFYALTSCRIFPFERPSFMTTEINVIMLNCSKLNYRYYLQLNTKPEKKSVVANLKFSLLKNGTGLSQLVDLSDSVTLSNSELCLD
jgi:hypothetical protein